MLNVHYPREMFELFNVNDRKGLTVFEIENGVVDMTQTGDMFDRSGNKIKYQNKLLFFLSEKAINDSFRHASRLKWEKEKSMLDKLDYTQFKLFLRILRMTYNFYEVRESNNSFLSKYYFE
jgi:hypothetical protein